jgi:hypothetical protein
VPFFLLRSASSFGGVVVVVEGEMFSGMDISCCRHGLKGKSCNLILYDILSLVFVCREIIIYNGNLGTFFFLSPP